MLRRWRNIREKLVKAGTIELFKGTIDIPGRRGDDVQKRVLTFMRLLKAEAPGGKVSIGMTFG